MHMTAATSAVLLAGVALTVVGTLRQVRPNGQPAPGTNTDQHSVTTSTTDALR